VFFFSQNFFPNFGKAQNFFSQFAYMAQKKFPKIGFSLKTQNFRASRVFHPVTVLKRQYNLNTHYGWLCNGWSSHDLKFLLFLFVFSNL